ncbi:MAG TPA: methyltransferase domain-containing protein [Dehalococcoidia bacterium]|nr:methyltransferase domain-containing protein [Dehalococcoidia bacterium]
MKLETIEDLSFADLICPFCHGELSSHERALTCRSCRKEYPVVDGIPSFGQKDEYWCNVRRETMQELNNRARESGDWLKAARELIPQYVEHIEPFDRADAQYLWPVNGESRVLDAGSMWGGLAIPAAQHCGEVFAVDKTIETLAFLKIRAKQMGFRNVHIVASPVQRLPFPDGYFDLVVLSGVLEWVAFDQDVVLEIHWGKRRQDSAVYSKDPRQVQVEVLREIQRVLKRGGHLYLAIENSIGYPYLAGVPDEHMNIMYVSFLPRFLANTITRWKLNCEYRTYTYSSRGYRSLLRDGGFTDMEYYGAFSHYIQPSMIIPADLIRHWKEVAIPVHNARWYQKLAVKMFPAGLLKYSSPSFIIMAKAPGGDEPKEARIVQVLRKAGLLDGSAPSDIKVVKSGGRAGSYHAANFLIYENNDTRPACFCKVCRNNRYADILENEAKNLKTVNRLLMDTELSACIPRLLYSGNIDNISILVTQYLEGAPSKFNLNTGFTTKNLRKLDSSIQSAIRFLATFQRYTQVSEVEATPHLLSVIESQRETLNEQERLTEEVDSRIGDLVQAIEKLDGLRIPVCAVHGDYDLCNLLFSGDRVSIVDFEHFESEGLPFFDLANLIFNPIILSYTNMKTSDSLLGTIARSNLENYIGRWLALYQRLSGLPAQLLELIGPLSVMEQNTKAYPYYREPRTYPMWGETMLNELLAQRIEL